MPIRLSHAEQQALTEMVDDESRPPREARRAKLILLAATATDGHVAEQVGSSPSTVALWRRRYAQDGIAGLQDRPRSGRPRLATSSSGEVGGPVENVDPSVAHLLEAACRTISRRGFTATRVVDIADEAGVSPATVHYHFKTRQEILLEALLWASSRLVDEFRESSADSDSPLARMAQTLEQMVPYPGRREDGYRLEVDLWAQARHHPGLQQTYAEYGEYWLREVTAVVEEGVRTGDFKIAAAPSEIAERLLALGDGLAAQAVSGNGRMTPDRIHQLLIAFAADQLGRAAADLS